MNRDNVLKGGLDALFNSGASTLANEPTASTGEEDVLETIENKALKEALHKRRMEGRGRPRKNDVKTQAAQGYQRITNIVNIEKMNKLREIALKEGLTIKEILEAVMDLAIERYESKNGVVNLNRKKASELFKK